MMEDQAQAAAVAAAAAEKAAARAALGLAPSEFAVGLRINLGGSFSSNLTAQNVSAATQQHVNIFLRGRLVRLSGGPPGLPLPGATRGVAGRAADSEYALAELSVWVNRSAAGSGSNTTHAEGGPVPLPQQSAAQPLSLSLWVDHSVLEVFALQGLARVTSRIYPSDDSAAWGVEAWALPPLTVPPQPPVGSGQEAASGSRGSSGSSSSNSMWQRLRCWWCGLWLQRRSSCSDCSCDTPGICVDSSEYVGSAGPSRSVNDSDAGPLWEMTADTDVWALQNAWLPPSC